MAGNRFWFQNAEDGGCNGRLRRRIYFSFNTNNGSAVNTSLIFGANDMLNANAGGSIVQTANTGEYTVTLSKRDFYNRVIFACARLEDVGTGLSAEVGTVSNEASSTSAPLSFKIYTYTSARALTNISNVRVWVEVVVMDKSNTGTGDP